MDCAICLESCNLASIKCSNHLCTEYICPNCLASYLSHTVNNSALPACVGRDCQGIYLYSDVLRTSTYLHEPYVRSCYQALIQSGKESITYDSIIAQLREEKKRYLRKEFPLAIAMVAEITCKVKLNKIKPPSKKGGRICMNLFCSGILDENLTCTICNSNFCKDCEKLKNSQEHQCKPEDIDSIKAVKELPQCPNCGLYVDKDEACDNVMCGVCGTKFIYRTKDLGGSGGHTKMVQVNQKISLTVAYKDKITDPNILNYILLIEGKEIKKVTYTTVMNAVKLGDPVRIARALEVYHKNRADWKRYMRYLNEIENMLQNGTITVNILAQVYQGL